MSETMTADIAALVGQLTAPTAATRIDAAERLCRAGATAVPAAVALVRGCGDEDAEVRDWCAAALEELGPPPADTVAELTTLVANPASLVAYWAATLLGRSGQAAATAVDTLAGCLTAADPAVAQRAAWALGKIGPAAHPATTALQSAAAGTDARLARLATEALAAIGG
jgi:HEAT repeat protein